MRLHALRPDELSDEQRALYDAINGGPRGPVHVTEDGSLQGPFNTFLHHPGIGTALQQVGAQIRYHGTLPDQARETAIIVAAAHHRANFEWYAHAPLAQKAGVPAEQVDAIRRGDRPELEDAAAQAAADVTKAVLDLDDLDDAAYESAVSALGEQGLIELLTLVGYYSTLAIQLNVFRVPLPAGVEPAFERQ